VYVGDIYEGVSIRGNKTSVAYEVSEGVGYGVSVGMTSTGPG